MLHRRFLVHRMSIGARRFPLRHGDLLVAARAESGALDWEAILHTVEVEPLSRQVHPVELQVVVEADDGTPRVEVFRGDAFLVRAVDRTLVLRGDGPLTGVDIASLHG